MKKAAAFCAILICALLFSSSSQAQQQKGHDEYFSVISPLSALSVYNSYLVLGSLADGLDQDIYQGDFVITLIEEQLSMYELLKDRMYEAISTESLNEHEESWMIETILVFDFIAEEAQALKNFVVKRTPAAAEAFQETRKTAWSAIALLLGVEE